MAETATFKINELLWRASTYIQCPVFRTKVTAFVNFLKTAYPEDTECVVEMHQPDVINVELPLQIERDSPEYPHFKIKVRDFGVRSTILDEKQILQLELVRDKMTTNSTAHFSVADLLLASEKLGFSKEAKKIVDILRSYYSDNAKVKFVDHDQFEEFSVKATSALSVAALQMARMEAGNVRGCEHLTELAERGYCDNREVFKIYRENSQDLTGELPVPPEPIQTLHRIEDLTPLVKSAWGKRVVKALVSLLKQLKPLASTLVGDMVSTDFTYANIQYTPAKKDCLEAITFTVNFDIFTDLEAPFFLVLANTATVHTKTKLLNNLLTSSGGLSSRTQTVMLFPVKVTQKKPQEIAANPKDGTAYWYPYTNSDGDQCYLRSSAVECIELLSSDEGQLVRLTSTRFESATLKGWDGIMPLDQFARSKRVTLEI
jgi:hypothetical protein